jgi:hypothetical protein
MGRGSHRGDKNTGDPLKKSPYSFFPGKIMRFSLFSVVHDKEKKLTVMLIYILIFLA